mgnify:CR=1 FL=1
MGEGDKSRAIGDGNYVIADLKQTIKNLKCWAKPKRVLPSILNFPSPVEELVLFQLL